MSVPIRGVRQYLYDGVGALLEAPLRPYVCVSIRARSRGSVKSCAVKKAPAPRSFLGSWLEAMPMVGMPAATEEEMPETESSKATALSAGTPTFSRATL